MMSHRVISNDGLKAMHKGCSVAVRVPWYRSLPVSVVEVVEITIDGTALPLNNVLFSIEGELIPIDQLDKQTKSVWYVLDDAYLVIPDANVEQGKTYDVAVTLAIYPPYIDDYKRITRTEKRLTAH